MTSFYLSFPHDILIQIKSSEDFVCSKMLLGAYVPGAEVTMSPTREVDIVVGYEKSENKGFIQEEARVVMRDKEDKEFPLDFYHLLYSVVRVQLLKKKLFSVHAACIGNNEYILVMGHTGVGKTSIVLRLLEATDMLLFSGNKTIIAFQGNGYCEALAGTRTITAHTKDMQQYKGEGYEPYGERIAVELRGEGYAKDPGRIKAIVLVSLNDGEQENDRINPTSALHKLYPYFLDTVNADTVLCDGDIVYIGTPPSGTQEYLARNLKEILVSLPVYSIKGSIDFISNAIKKI